MYKMLIHSGVTLLTLFVLSCSGSKPSPASMPGEESQYGAGFDISLLGEGTEIKAAGLQLMELAEGMHVLHKNGSVNDSVLIVLVHGYQSGGYEWVSAAKGLVEEFGAAHFFRYDWEICPDVLGEKLADEVRSLARGKQYERVVLFGHSYGGMVLTYTASALGKMDAELHVIAAPLSGFPRLLDACNSLVYDEMDRLTYPEWHEQVQVIQHKTVHAQDGAFRELATDPQDLQLGFSEIIQLPPTMDGHRLGHNWSVTWVIDSFLGRPHRH